MLVIFGILKLFSKNRHAFFLPGLGQIIVGRVKKGVEIIGIAIACFFGGFFLISGFAMLESFGFVFFMALFLMLALVVVWVYALVDVIIGEVRPLREEKNEQ